MTCFDKLMVHGDGVIADQAQVLFTDDNRAVDVVRLVDAAIRARWPGHEHLHLQIHPGSCDRNTLVLPFSGSHIRVNSSGSAYGLQGVVRITGRNDHHVSIRPQ